MSDLDQNLTLIPPEDLKWTLTYALQFDGKRHFRASGEYTAKFMAAHLAECLRKLASL